MLGLKYDFHSAFGGKNEENVKMNLKKEQEELFEAQVRSNFRRFNLYIATFPSSASASTAGICMCYVLR